MRRAAGATHGVNGNARSISIISADEDIDVEKYVSKLNMMWRTTNNVHSGRLPSAGKRGYQAFLSCVA
jgi:hypothetical protein